MSYSGVLINALEKLYLSKRRTSAHVWNYASEAGHPCLRFLTLARLRPDLRPLVSLELQRIYEEGNRQEKAVVSDIREAGFDLDETHVSFRWPEFELSGAIDGFVKIDGAKIPIEIKSAAPYSFDDFKRLTPGEMMTSEQFFIRKYITQIGLYLLMTNSPVGILFFKNKVSGAPHAVDVELEPGAKRYDELMTGIKEWAKAMGRDSLVGDYLVKVKTYETTRYDVPAEIKKSYAVKTEAVRVTLERLGGDES